MNHSSKVRIFSRFSDSGFVILGMVCMMLVMGITAVALNRNASMQVKMTEAYVDSVQVRLGQQALTEWAMWKLNSDPFFRTPEGGLIKEYAGNKYIVFVMQLTTPGLSDAVAISVKPLEGGSIPTTTTAVRFYVEDLLPQPKVPEYVCTDPYGNIYFSDVTNHIVYKINSSGRIIPFAGNGSAGYSGDGGKAIAAELNSPRGLAFHNNHLYIADTDNHRIRKVSAFGDNRITTIAGNGVQGMDSSPKNALYSKLNRPYDVSIQDENIIYIADTGNHRICMMKESRKLYTLAGTGEPGYDAGVSDIVIARLNSPEGVGVRYTDGGSSNDVFVFIADTGNHLIREVSIDFGSGYNYPDTWSKTIMDVAGNNTDGFCEESGHAPDTQIGAPRDVFVDTDTDGPVYNGNLYVTTGNAVIKLYWHSCGKLKVDIIAGGPKAGYVGDGGPAEDAKLRMPTGVAFDGSKYIIADTGNSTIRKIESGRISSLWPGTPNIKKPTQLALYYNPEADREYLYVTDTDYHDIKKIDLTDRTVSTIAGNGGSACSSDDPVPDPMDVTMMHPEGIAVDPETGDIYFSDTDCHCVRKIDAGSGQVTTVAGIPGSVGRVDTDNGFKVYDLCNDPLHPDEFKMKRDSGFIPSLVKFNKPKGLSYNTFRNSLTIVDSGNCLVFDLYFSKNLMKVSGQLECISNKVKSCGSGEDMRVPFDTPAGAYVDPAGYTFISDMENHRIMRRHKSSSFTSHQYFERYAGIHDDNGFENGHPLNTAKFDQPYGFAGNGTDQMYITDNGNHSIRIYLDGKIKTVSGIEGKKGNNRSKVLAVEAKYNHPTGIAVSHKSPRRIYIADSGNKRIRMIYFQKEPLIYRLPPTTSTSSTTSTTSTTTTSTSSTTTTTAKPDSPTGRKGGGCRPGKHRHFLPHIIAGIGSWECHTPLWWE